MSDQALGPRRVRVIGLGNSILKDDGVGIHVARALRRRLAEGAGAPGGAIDVVEACQAGFGLLDLLQGWDHVVIIDALMLDGLAPGEIVCLRPTDVRATPHLCAAHGIDLPTALALGEQLGYAMPREIVIFAVQAADLATLSEQLSPPVAAAIPEVLAQVLGHLATCA